MSFNAKVRQNQLSAVLPISGAPVVTVSGTRVTMANVKTGTLSARASVALTTNTLGMTAKWQGSEDGSTWYELRPSNGAAYVAHATGTGSLVTTIKVYDAPQAAYGYRFVRLSMVSDTGTGTGGSADVATISYNWMGV